MSETPHIIPPENRQWFVLYTKSRCEKKVADGLKAAGIEVFCPMLRIKKKWSDRYKWVEEPLLRSYCMVKLAERERHLVFGVPGVVRYLFWLQRPAIVKAEEIEVIRQLLDSAEHSSISVRAFEPDDRIRIKTGVFSELTGTVQEQRGGQLYLYLEALQAVVSVNTNHTMVEHAGLPGQ